ncbi:membrane-associated protein [Arthrobacter sp. CAN_A6]|uniref:DedA family protein n=1 Tax=Arthrobacter sp. CAN_A6 TaxID=2787721 RepID=UPI0018CB81FE
MIDYVATGVPTGVSWSDLADPAALLQGAGGWVLLAVAAIVFIESGVLFPFLPGDSLIFTAGLLHAQLGVQLAVLVTVIVSAAILGDQVGYWLGRRFGRRLFKDDARVLNTRYLTHAEQFFARYGGRSLVLARFVPFARTFVPLAAGTAHYRYPAFLMWNVLGGVLWGAGLTVAGSLLGGVPFIADHVDLIALVIVVVSVVPTLIEIFRQVRKNRAGSSDWQPAGEMEGSSPGISTGASTGSFPAAPSPPNMSPSTPSWDSLSEVDRRAGEFR